MGATHIRKKTGERVVVTRAYDQVVVRTLQGAFIHAYSQTEMALFQKRYQRIEKKRGGGP